MVRAPIHADQRGFTIVEVLVAISLLLIGVLGTVTMIDGANATTRSTLAREGATNLARQLVEGARAVSYPELVSGDALAAALRAQPGLADENDGDLVWTVRRRDVTFTITATVCSVDDELDGYGPHPSIFCSDSAAPGSADRNPDDYKRVAVTVSWRDGQSIRQTRQSTLIPNPGGSAGPLISGFAVTAPIDCDLAAPSCAVVEQPLSAEVDFSLTTASPAETVAWAIDGEPQPAETVGGSGSDWSFQWPIPPAVVDGTYLISARAFSASQAEGVPATAGAERVLTVTLNRFAAAKPNGFAAGRTSSVAGGEIVDMEWLSNPERDIEGYRVFRVVGAIGGSDDVAICPAAPTDPPITKTTCQDPAPPDADAIAYYVAAADRDPDGVLRLGDPSDVRTVTRDNSPPFAPIGPVLQAGSETTELAWATPDPQDPDSGDAIDFFRIYRDGTSISDRYDRVAGTVNMYEDFKSAGEPHSYWVTAVDNQLGESAPVQAVPAG